jgi:hypothetical protein
MGFSTTTEVIDMRFFETILFIFALIGVWAVMMAAFFWLGYATYCPPCNSVLAIFTETCK